MRSLFLSYFKSDLFEVLKTVIASHGEHILIQSIKLSIAAFSNNSEHIWLIVIRVIDGIIFESNGDINLLDGAGKEHIFAKGYILLTDLNKVFGFVEQLILRLFDIFFLRLVSFLLLLIGTLLIACQLEIAYHFRDLFDLLLLF
jgi:hypothetical protein